MAGAPTFNILNCPLTHTICIDGLDEVEGGPCSVVAGIYD
jgi:hypothetical protein